jgi:outer membrane protein assembly factor BamB
MLSRRRILIGLGVLVVLAAGGLLFVLNHGPGNVSNPHVEFDAPTATATPTASAKKQAKPKPFVWTTYAYSPDRRRSVDIPKRLRPPFHERWFYNGEGLLEFPPVISAKSLFIVHNDGNVQSVDKFTGKVRWNKHVGSLAASTPQLDIPGEKIYVTLLSHYGTGSGRIVALSTRTGSTVWSRNLPSRSESSPLQSGKAIYFGSEDGTVYALSAKTGAIKWRFHAAGPVKAALAAKNGRLFFGDYAGRLYAISQSTGKLIWEAHTKGARFGFASGRFYGNAAVAFGRVYIGNVDSYVYSFSARTGQLAWRTKTNGYVYGSPSIGTGPGGRPAVFIGSYDGTFYALDARSGAIRWRYYTGGAISGGSTILGPNVWVGDIRRRQTYALNTRTGHKVFQYRNGGYSSVVTDKQTLFVVGYGAIYALEPLSAQRRRAIAARKRKRAQVAIQRRRDCVHTVKRVVERRARWHKAFLHCVAHRHASHKHLYHQKPRHKPHRKRKK